MPLIAKTRLLVACLGLLAVVGCAPHEKPTPAPVAPASPAVFLPTETAALPTSTATLSVALSNPTQSENLQIDEYLLKGPPDISTEQLVFEFAVGDKERLLAKTAPYRDWRAQILEHNNAILQRFGYRQQNIFLDKSDNFYWKARIYRGDELLADADYVGPLSMNQSQTDFIGQVSLSDGDYVFTRTRFEKLAWPPGRQPKAFLGDQLLSVEMTSSAHQQGTLHIYLDNQPAYQFDMQYGRPTYGDYLGPWTYGGHWAVVLLDTASRVLLDGQDVNSLYGYDESFEFSLLSDRPFFFYRQDEKINLWFDGQEIARGYDEIPHYNCCSPALLNPGRSLNLIYFFARRGEDWYYVEAYVPN